MTIQSEWLDDNSVVIFLSGRLDTNSAPKFELELKSLVERAAGIILDFKDLSYISSSGLHILLQTQRAMNNIKRKFVIKNLGEAVRDVLEMTGVINLISLEE